MVRGRSALDRESCILTHPYSMASIPLSTQAPITSDVGGAGDDTNLLEKRSPAGRSIANGLPNRNHLLTKYKKGKKWMDRLTAVTEMDKKGKKAAEKQADYYRGKKGKEDHVQAWEALAAARGKLQNPYPGSVSY
jgi:hypothetical protein